MDHLRESQLLETAETLLSMRTTADCPEMLARAIDFVEVFFQQSPVKIERSEEQGKPAAVITTLETRYPSVLLQGHLDVVEALPEQFLPRRAGNRLFARGAVDMKAFVAVAMHVLRDLAVECPGIDAGLMVTTDEEIGGDCGAGRLVREGWSTELLVNGDGGHGDAVSFAEKGIVQVDVEAVNQPGQRYAPWDGESAANVLLRHLVRGLELLCPQQRSLTAQENWGTTYCILSMSSSSPSPMPPSRATASIRLYWAGCETGEMITRQVSRALAPLQARVTVVAPPVHIDPGDERLQSLRSLLETHLGRPFAVRADNGASDAKWFAGSGAGIVLLRFPGGGAHTPKEWLEIDAFVPLYKALKEYVVRHARIGGASKDAALPQPTAR